MLRGCLVLPSRSSSAARSGSTRRSVARRPRPTAGRRGKGAKPWVVPRTPDGKPISRATGPTRPRRRSSALWKPPRGTLTEEQANAIEKRALDVEEFRDRPSVPTARRRRGGERGRLAAPGQQSFIEIIAEAAGGTVGGYNGFWLEPGLNVIRIDGVAFSSIIIDPPNGRVPPLTDAGKRVAEIAARSKVRRVRSSRDAAALGSLPDLVWIQRRPADAAVTSTTTTPSCRPRIT